MKHDAFRRRILLLATSLTLSLLLGCASEIPERSWTIDARRYAVAADHVDASQAGAEILAQGGNAVDAAVATSFALAVVRPESCGLGGGGFMLIHRPGAAPIALDYREQAPARTQLDLYRDANGRLDPARIQRGGLSVGIPGTVRGLLHAFEHYGSGRLTLAQVMAPAMRIANCPLPVNTHLADSIDRFRKACADQPTLKKRHRELYHVLFEDDDRPRTHIDRSSIAITLEAIADRGAEGFYDGPIAKAMIRAAKADGGILSQADLSAYRVHEVRPIERTCFDHEVLAMPPPSSGGAVIIEALNILEAIGADKIRAAWAIEAGQPIDAAHGANVRFGDYTHDLIEAMKPPFADRAKRLGDSSPQVEADVARMIDPARARRIANRIDQDHAAPWTQYNEGAAASDDGGTSHFSIIDADGMAVACTESVNLLFGSRILVPDTGIILNDTMDDFALDTATPNAFGLRQSERNLVRAGARPLSSMSPTIVLKESEVRLVVGASGGPRIISSTLQTLLNVVVGESRVDDAVAAPRVHHQWLPDEVRVQPGISQRLRVALRNRGHTIEERADIGHVQAVERLADGKLRAACDPGKGGRPAGE